MPLPPKKAKQRMGLREPAREFPGHQKWVRQFACCVPGCQGGPIEFAHVRKGIPSHEAGGTSLKPHDKWGVSLCAEHHREQHQIGEDSFQARHGVDLKAKAQAFARASPHRQKWESAA